MSVLLDGPGSPVLFTSEQPLPPEIHRAMTHVSRKLPRILRGMPAGHAILAIEGRQRGTYDVAELPAEVLASALLRECSATQEIRPMPETARCGSGKGHIRGREREML
jgi:hypothetical protein